uniref:Uncharacterized protein n=1 Tax=Oryza meridionalis TaxID=40149 RepID=A0A0E0CP35_9ORYZ
MENSSTQLPVGGATPPPPSPQDTVDNLVMVLTVAHNGKCTLSLDRRCPQYPNVKTHVPVILDMKSLNYTKWRIFFIVSFLGKFGMLGHDIVEDGLVEKAVRMGKSSCTLCRLHLLEEEVQAHEVAGKTC